MGFERKTILPYTGVWGDEGVVHRFVTEESL